MPFRLTYLGELDEANVIQGGSEVNPCQTDSSATNYITMIQTTGGECLNYVM